MKQILEKCEHCGAKKVIDRHLLTPGLVSALQKAARLCVQTGNRNFQKSVVNQYLTKSEAANWTKLRFHALIAKVRVEGKHKRGWWIITRQGWDFLAGRLAVPHAKYTFRNKVLTDFVPESGVDRLVTIRDIKGMTPYFETIEDIHQIPVNVNRQGVLV